ncbi:MAG: penicillin-binding transpeptidase domain-containing protein [Anaerolineae bacterium]
MNLDHTISFKANRILNLILLSLLLILIRVWYLTVIQHDAHLEQAHQPQRRSKREDVERATIRDRFNIPLAMNKIQYRAAVCYAEIREIPNTAWKKDENGKPIRILARSAYISDLARLLAKELEMDPTQIEDTIHGKASLFPHLPFVIKEDLSEKQYYRLRMLEREWLGIRTERGSKRHYPQGKTACDVIGYMGAISQKEYLKVANEIQALQNYLSQREAGDLPILPQGFHSPIEVRERLRQLQEKAYTIHDLVGKAGIEGAFDEKLRGIFGKKIFEVDIKGNFLRELPGSRTSISGQRIVLTLSSELQQFAETLLAYAETSSSHETSFKNPWIKGGAIVAMIPKTGEIVAMASYPRFDPNDFISSAQPSLKRSKKSSVSRWLETPTYIGEIWDGKRLLEKEVFSFSKGSFHKQSSMLNFEHYLEAILPVNSEIRKALDKLKTLEDACRFQRTLKHLLDLSKQPDLSLLVKTLYEADRIPSLLPASKQEKENIWDALSQQREVALHLKNEADQILKEIEHQDDLLLLVDLCRLIVKEEEMSPSLLAQIGTQTLSFYRSSCQFVLFMQSHLAPIAQELFHETLFKTWRERHFKDFMKEKRKEEKSKKRYARPYTDYLELCEKEAFQKFWDQYRLDLLAALILGSIDPSSGAELSPFYQRLIQEHEELIQKLQEMTEFNGFSCDFIRTFKQSLLTLPLLLRKEYLKTVHSFEELKRPLLGRYRNLKHHLGVQQEKHLAAAFYPLTGYGYGRSQAFRQTTPQGSPFKLVTAYQALKERLIDLRAEANDSLALNPLTLIDDLQGHAKTSSNAQVLGFTTEGQPISRLYKNGRLPRSSHPHIGKVDLIQAIEQSSNLYFSILASDKIKDPSSLAEAAHAFGFGEQTGIQLPGEIKGNVPDDLDYNRTGLYAFAIGQHSLIVTPLQTAVMLSAIANGGSVLKPKIVQVIAGKETDIQSETLFSESSFTFQHDLLLTGITFPLFTETHKDPELPYVYDPPTEVKRQLFFPDEIRHTLLEGMHRVINGPRGTARPSVIRDVCSRKEEIQDYLALQNDLVGKTGTAEILYKHTLDAGTSPSLINHIWFGGISFPSPTLFRPSLGLWEEPELVVVVYLRFGKSGKEAAPIAAQIVKKWREICKKHSQAH